MEWKQNIISRLKDLAVPFSVYEHAPAFSMEDCMHLEYYHPGITICKNILLCNRQQTDFYLYVTMPDRPFRTKDVSKLLGVSRLSFAPTEMLTELFHLQSGSLAPFALWADEENKVTFVVDRRVMQTDAIAFHPCDNTASLVFLQRDFWSSVVPHLYHNPILLEIPEE